MGQIWWIGSLRVYWGFKETWCYCRRVIINEWGNGFFQKNIFLIKFLLKLNWANFYWKRDFRYEQAI